MNEPVFMECCKVYTHNEVENHMCVPYRDDQPCSRCGAGTIYVLAGAPGTGGATVCRNNHYTNSTIRVMEPWEVR